MDYGIKNKKVAIVFFVACILTFISSFYITSRREKMIRSNYTKVQTETIINNRIVSKINSIKGTKYSSLSLLVTLDDGRLLYIPTKLDCNKMGSGADIVDGINDIAKIGDHLFKAIGNDTIFLQTETEKHYYVLLKNAL